jgi:hypothetical protein
MTNEISAPNIVDEHIFDQLRTIHQKHFDVSSKMATGHRSAHIQPTQTFEHSNRWTLIDIDRCVSGFDEKPNGSYVFINDQPLK